MESVGRCVNLIYTDSFKLCFGLLPTLSVLTKFVLRSLQHSYKVDWGELPKVIAQELQQQLSNKRWSGEVTSATSQSNIVSRSQSQVEIVRATCFTSYKSSTDKNSLRVKMFDQMEAAGYDMITMETVGKGEKCVDIALAVDMLHYATIPGSMDICILLTGDKDFIPACLRVRQKGVQLAVVSMHRGCNRALNDTPHMKDFDIVFLDHHLTNLVVPNGARKRNDSIHAMDIIKAIYGFILGNNGEVSFLDFLFQNNAMFCSSNKAAHLIVSIYYTSGVGSLPRRRL